MRTSRGMGPFIMLLTFSTFFTVGYTNEAAQAAPEVTPAAAVVEQGNFSLTTPVVKDITGNINAIDGEKQILADAKISEVVKKAEEAQKAREAAEAARIEKEKAKAAAQARPAAQSAAQPAGQQSSSDLNLMAAIIFCEAGNQSYEGQVAVGAVIMNRVRSGVFPNSIHDVVYQSGQFGPAVTGWLNKVIASGGYTDSAMQAAKDALAGSNPIGNCLYFDQGGRGMQIGAHYFH